jgi:hypothetical protein
MYQASNERADTSTCAAPVPCQAAGANVNAVNSDGLSPLQLAAVHNLPAMVKVLLAAGADASYACPHSGQTALDLAQVGWLCCKRPWS